MTNRTKNTAQSVQMTPQWSGDLTTAIHSPLFTRDLEGARQRQRFVEQATQYATYDDLPPRLQEVYRRAMAAYDDGGTEEQP
jgi:hypothetical protein